MKRGKEKIPSALILAAGNGMRLKNPVPKPIFKLLGVPLLARTLFTLEEAGITDAYIVVGYEADHVRNSIEKIGRFKINLHWLKNDLWDKPNGLSVLVAEKILTEPFILCMCDHIFDSTIVEKLKATSENLEGINLAVDYDLERIFDLNDATKVRVENGRIKKIGKFLPDYNAVDTGVFLATPKIFKAVREAIDQDKYALSDGVQKLADMGLAQVTDIEGLMWEDIDTSEDAKEGAKKLLSALGKPKDGPVSKYLNRPISKTISRYLVNTPITPNLVTFLNMIVGLIAAGIASIGGYLSFLLCAILFQLNSIIDGTDGEIARLKFLNSKQGQWIDTVADNIVYIFCILGVTIGVKRMALPEIYFISGIISLIASLGSFSSLYIYLIRRKKSGSLLDVKYGYEKWNNLLSRFIYYAGKRDTWALAFLLMAIFGIAHVALILCLGSIGGFLASLRLNFTLPRVLDRKKRLAPLVSSKADPARVYDEIA